MKYLKKIFETVDKEELLEFCESNLIYLIDEGFNVNLDKGRVGNDGPYSLYIKITKGYTGNEYFKWNDIKDYFIPFIKRLTNSYKLENNKLYWNPSALEFGRPTETTSGIIIDYFSPSEKVISVITPSLEQVLNDKIHDNIKTKQNEWDCMDFIYEINILIKE